MNEFKPGDVVRCVDNQHFECDLDIGSFETVSGIDQDCVKLKRFGDNRVFNKTRFVLERDYEDLPPKHDQVNNPSHYQIMPGVEVIHVRRALLDKIPAGANLNAVDEWSRSWEYLTRAWSKNGLEDFKKAQVYLGWLIDRLENETET